MEAAHHVPFWVKASSSVAMLAGLGVAWLFYLRAPQLPGLLAARHPVLHAFLLNKWYFDELYEAALVRPAKWLGRQLWLRGDGGAIDGLLHAVALRAVPALTDASRRLQSGYLYHYAFAMVLGIAALVTWLTVGVG